LAGAFITFKNELLIKVSIFLGNVSYGVYLFHIPLYGMIKNLDLGVFSVPLTMIVSTLVAAVVFKYWELYWVRVGKKLTTHSQA